jgi:hypothetical protein
MTTEREPVQAFLDMIESSRRARATEISSQATREAVEIVAHARAEARERARRAVLETRARSDQALAAAHAELGTLLRRSSQDAHRAALAEGAPQLEQALLERWQDPRLRKAWIDGLLADALGILPRTGWRIEHPTDFSPSEFAEASAMLERHSGVSPELVPDANVRAGLRIFASSAVLDGSTQGLLARRADVEGQLLAEVDAGLGRNDEH